MSQAQPCLTEHQERVIAGVRMVLAEHFGEAVVVLPTKDTDTQRPGVLWFAADHPALAKGLLICAYNAIMGKYDGDDDE